MANLCVTARITYGVNDHLVARELMIVACLESNAESSPLETPIYAGARLAAFWPSFMVGCQT